MIFKLKRIELFKHNFYRMNLLISYIYVQILNNILIDENLFCIIFPDFNSGRQS